jgi:hypothetical protein
MRKTRNARRGTVAVLTALCLIGVMGFAALALDAALLHNDRRSAQAAADAAALAAAGNLFANYRTYAGTDPLGSAAKEAKAAAKANGFNDDGVTNSVTVNVSPAKYEGGPHAGTPLPAGCAEVIVTQYQARAFSAIWGTDKVTVKARAVGCGKWAPKNNGIIVLDPTSSGSLNSSGGSSVTVQNANVIVDSNSPSAVVVTGGGSLTAPEFDITGNPGTSTSNGATINGRVLGNQVPTPDPLAYLPEPDPTSLNLTVQATKTVKLTSTGSSLALLPGVYQGGINVTGGSLTLAPGIYYMDGGGFSFSGSGSLTAEGVMLVNAPATKNSNSDVISITGSGTINLSPMTTGTYQGISLWQTRTSTNTIKVSGGGSGSITGTFYAQHGTLDVSGGGGASVGSQYISYDVNLGGNGAFTVNWQADATAPIRVVQLVE